MIESIVVEGIEYSEPNRVRQAIVKYFKSHYTARTTSSFDIQQLGLARLNENQKQSLIERFLRKR